jgi:hypothetical protein
MRRVALLRRLVVAQSSLALRLKLPTPTQVELVLGALRPCVDPHTAAADRDRCLGPALEVGLALLRGCCAGHAAPAGGVRAMAQPGGRMLVRVAARSMRRVALRRRVVVQTSLALSPQALNPPQYSDAKVANRDAKVWHLVTENRYWMMDKSKTPRHKVR